MWENMSTDEIIEIHQIQCEFRKAGYQWEERIFNDGHLNGDCAIDFTLSEDPTFFSYGVGEVGWGRFDRLTAWRKAGEWLRRSV